MNPLRTGPKPSREKPHRSETLPGLWLDGAALVGEDVAKVLATLQQGLASPEHAEFVERLRGTMKSSGAG